jgi:hypothetical protein
MKKILFIVGSPNQTSQMHQIASNLPEYDCYFSQFFSDNWFIKAVVKTGLLDQTILAGHWKAKADKYLKDHNLKNDYAGRVYGNTYDLVVLCTELIVPSSVRHIKTVWVQEGMVDPLTTRAKIVRALNLPGFLAGSTALNGAANLCDVYCAASHGYKNYFTKLGTDGEKILVTGIPNYDNILATIVDNDFPYHGYVFVATSDIRECYGTDDRPAFLKKAVQIANGRRLIIKLHPNEKVGRAVREIKENTPPDTLVYTDGNINHMIANCSELITQYSTVVYTGIALNKKVHSYFDIDFLKRHLPIQNGGKSAALIAQVCREYIEHKDDLRGFLANAQRLSEPKLDQPAAHLQLA